jgi:hypothetical protein
VGAAAVRRAWVASASIAGASAAAASGRAWPQLAQNFASAATLASHRGQRCGGDWTLIDPIVAQGVTAPGGSIGDAAPFAGGCLADVPSRLAKPACCRLRAVLWQSGRAKHLGCALAFQSRCRELESRRPLQFIRRVRVARRSTCHACRFALVPAAPTSRSGWLPTIRRPRPSGSSDIASATRCSGACRTTGPWSLSWTLMDPVSCVSCVSSWYCVNAAETHETFRRESGMRYQHSSRRPDRRLDRAVSLSADRGAVPYLVPHRLQRPWRMRRLTLDRATAPEPSIPHMRPCRASRAR